MKKRNMLTKVAALSMAALMTVTGLPVAGLDGALSVEAAKWATNDLKFIYATNSENMSTEAVKEFSHTLTVGDYEKVELVTGSNLAVKASYKSNNKKVISVVSSREQLNLDNEVVSGPATSAYIVARVVTDNAVVEAAVNSGDTATSDPVNLNYVVNPKSLTDTEDLSIKLKVVKSGTPTQVIQDEKEVVNDSSPLNDQTYNKNGYTVTLASANVGKANLDITNELRIKVTNDNDEVVSGPGVSIKGAKTWNLIIEGKDDNVVAGELQVPFTITNKSLEGGRFTKIPDFTYSVNGNANKANVISSGNVTIKDVNNDEVDSSKYEVDVYGPGGSGSLPVYTETDDGLQITATPVAGSGYDTSTSITGKSNAKKKKIDEAKADYINVYNTGLNKNLSSVVIPELLADGATDLKLDNQLATGDSIIPDINIYDGEALDKSSPLYAENGDNGTYTKDDTVYHFAKLVEGTDYDITVNGTTKNVSGTGSIKITFKGNYTGSLSASFKIVDSNKGLDGNTEVTMTFNKSKELANGGSLTYREEGWEKDGAYPVLNIAYTNPETQKVTKQTGLKAGSNAGDFKTVIEDNNKVGTATVKIIGTDNLAGTIEQTFTIDAKGISSATGGGAKNASITYTGSAQTPESKDVTDNITKQKLSDTDDYSISYDNNINAGTASIIYTGKGNYTGTKTVTFEIKPVSIKGSADINGFAVKTIDNQVLAGEAVTPAVEATFLLKDGTKQVLTEGTDYTLTYENNNAVGIDKATVSIKGGGNFDGVNTRKFTIVSAENDLSKAEITLTNDSVEYDGKAHSAQVKSVKLGDTLLGAGTDYTSTVVTETEVGEYDVTIVGVKKNSSTAVQYGGTGVAKFTITAATAAVDFKLSATSKTYNGKAQSVTVSDVTRDGVAITEDEYEVTGTTKSTAAGKKTVTVKLTGNYSGSASKTWTINKAANPVKVSPTSKSFKVKAVKKAKKTFTIKATKAQGKVTYKSSSKKVTVTSKGKVTVKKGTKKGTYKITVKAAGNSNYKAASKTVTIKVK